MQLVRIGQMSLPSGRWDPEAPTIWPDLLIPAGRIATAPGMSTVENDHHLRYACAADSHHGPSTRRERRRQEHETRGPDDRTTPIRTDQPLQHGDAVRGRRPGAGQPGGRGPYAGAAAWIRREPYRHRRAVRGFGASHRAVDGAAPEGLLPRHEDRVAHRRRGPRGHPPLARAPARRPRGSDPAPLARAPG